MKNRIAKFEKVSIKQFVSDFNECIGGNVAAARMLYDNIAIPRRATAGSAGYDQQTKAGIFR